MKKRNVGSGRELEAVAFGLFEASLNQTVIRRFGGGGQHEIRICAHCTVEKYRHTYICTNLQTLRAQCYRSVHKGLSVPASFWQCEVINCIIGHQIHMLLVKDYILPW